MAPKAKTAPKSKAAPKRMAALNKDNAATALAWLGRRSTTEDSSQEDLDAVVKYWNRAVDQTASMAQSRGKWRAKRVAQLTQLLERHPVLRRFLDDGPAQPRQTGERVLRHAAALKSTASSSEEVTISKVLKQLWNGTDVTDRWVLGIHIQSW